jgi:ribosomal protein S18 acetylase RimI-like enzyme
MGTLGTITYLRPCTEADDAFVYDVFCTTWESEVAALPNQNLAQHVLRIQHIAQERRFENRYPGYQRYVVVEEGEPAGRLYVHVNGPMMHVIDLTLLPRFQNRGIGSRIFRDVCAVAAREGRSVTLRVPRRNVRAADLYASLGFHLVTVDDVDSYFEWTAPVNLVKEAAVKEAAVKENEAQLLPEARSSR